MEKKVHYKMHKVKKNWVALAVSTLSIAALTSVAGDVTVSADQVDAGTTQDQQVTNVESSQGSQDLSATTGLTTTDVADATATAVADDASQTQAATVTEVAVAADTTSAVDTSSAADSQTADTTAAAATADTATVSAQTTTVTVNTADLGTATADAATLETSLVATRASSSDAVETVKNGASHVKTVDGKQYYIEDDGTVRKNYVLERAGGSQYFNADSGELSDQKTYQFDDNGGTAADANQQAQTGDKNALYSTSDKDVETVDGYFTANTWYRPKEILKDGTTWTASTENDKRPLLSVWWPSKTIQANYLNYMARQGLGTDQNFTSSSNQATMNQAAQDIQKAIEVKIGQEGTDWLRTTIENFVKTQPGWNSSSENLDNNDHLQGGALLFNNDDRTSQANSDYRLLNRTPTNQTGVHNPKYTADTSNGGYEFLLANDIDNSNPVVQAEQLNWLHYIMNIGTLTGGSSDENFDGVRVDAVDNVDADLLQIASDYLKARYKMDQSEADAIKHMSIQEAWSHNDPYYSQDMNDAALSMDDRARLSMVYSLLRPINGGRSGLEPLVTNSLNDRSATGKTSKRMANYTFVRAHDSEVQTVIGTIIKAEINPESTGNTFTLEEMKKAFEIYNADMRKAEKTYTQYNIPSAYALMLTNKDTVPRVYYGDMYTDDGQYMAQESPYHAAIETLLKARIKYISGGQDMQVNYGITSSTPSQLSGWTPADILTSVRYGKGADSATDTGDALTRTSGAAVIIASNPTMKLTGNLRINMGAAHKNQAYRPLITTTTDGLATYASDSSAESLIRYTDADGYLTFTAGEIAGVRNPQVDGYLAVWVPVGASDDQDIRVAASTEKNANGQVYVASAALDSQVIYEGFSNFQDFVENDSQYTNKKIAENAALFQSWGVTTFEFAPQYVSSDDGTFLDSVIQNGYAFSDRYDIAMSKNNKYGSLDDLKAALKAVHAHGMTAIADWVPDQIYNLPGDEVVTATRVNNYGETKSGATINHTLYAAKTRTNGNDYQAQYGGKYLDELKSLYPQIFERVQISTGKTIDPSEKITSWSAKYMNGTNILGRGADYVLKNSAGQYLSTRDGSLNLPVVLGSDSSSNNDTTDGAGKFVRRIIGVSYYYNDGSLARNAFIKDSKGNVYYFNAIGRMVTGARTINGKEYYFLANGVQLRNGYRQDRQGRVFYYGADGVLTKNQPTPQPTPDNSPRNRFEQIGDNVWAYYNANGQRVVGRQTINGQNLYFDSQGKQVKGRAVTVDGALRYYDANSGEMIVNRFEQIGDNVWAYFGNDGAAVTGLQTINGQTLYFDQDGKQVKGRTVVINGQTRYFDANSGEMATNRFVQIGDNVWAYFDSKGNAVKGLQTINGQSLYFDRDGKQVKGRTARVGGVLRYFDADSGEMVKNQWVQIAQGQWMYFDAQGRGRS